MKDSNSNNKCVMQDWVLNLSWKQQAVLLSAIRGCDGVGKNDLSKKFVRKLRSVVLKNAGAPGCEFMESYIPPQEVYEFSKGFDAYPIHFLLHLIHAYEIVGYCYEGDDREFFENFYKTMVRAFHMKPERIEEMHYRLRDGVDTVCHKS